MLVDARLSDSCTSDFCGIFFQPGRKEWSHLKSDLAAEIIAFRRAEEADFIRRRWVFYVGNIFCIQYLTFYVLYLCIEYFNILIIEYLNIFM